MQTGCYAAKCHRRRFDSIGPLLSESAYIVSKYTGCGPWCGPRGIAEKGDKGKRKILEHFRGTTCRFAASSGYLGFKIAPDHKSWFDKRPSHVIYFFGDLIENLDFIMRT